MQRRSLMFGALSSLLGANLVRAGGVPDWVPVPKWSPEVIPDLKTVSERMVYYFGSKYDYVLFSHSTCCVLDKGKEEQAAIDTAMQILLDIVGFHPDFATRTMTDGAVLVSYNESAFNVLPAEFTLENQAWVAAEHLQGLTEGEALWGKGGLNKFDQEAQMGLLGRSYMFLDAEARDVVQVIRG
ncbi:hypothetical protein TRP8649_00874 [Pelagimonas phthalicica]|uniref:Uncharacterized protein n=1 Tax=Pelagimonas phthalicica TaxID=1037362 RepID=A0A238J7Z2_9RHOB|nr:hypothetical protein [Pelagimonas phthalicica]TDS94684.1 hypothetical protein CLV87_1197 [Pelagimonas phthalicica]SMX26788.1 hypothetical protein TRP8649_00874 [Pelagimonas phthalicica]